MNDIVWGSFTKAKKDSLSSNIDGDELYRDRNEIWFSCGVSSKSINKTIKLIYEAIHDEKLSAYRDGDNDLEIVLHIDSYGGHPCAAFKLIDYIEQLKKKKIRFRTIINGRACSAATLIALIGDKKQITKHSYAMIHELQTASEGYHTHLKSYMKYLQQLHQQIVDVYNKYRSSKKSEENESVTLEITLEIIEKWMANETWFDAQEYLKIGFVDEIIS